MRALGASVELSNTFTLSLTLVASILLTQMLPGYAQSHGDAFTNKAKAQTAQRQHVWQVLMERAQKGVSDKSPGKAEACFMEARKIAEDLRATFLLLRTLHEQAKFYNDLKLNSRALEVYDDAFKVFLKTVDHYPREKWYYAYESADMKGHAEMFAEYALLLESQDLSKKLYAVKSLSNRLNDSVEHHKQLEEQRKQSEEERRKSKDYDLDFGPYMVDMHRRVVSNWIPLRSDANTGRVVTRFRVEANGTIDNVKIVSPSNSPTENEACMKAITEANPLRQLPEGAPSNIDVQFTFDAFGK